jgi:hypothetical protein
MTVQNGDPLPKANFTVMIQDGLVLFGVPGAFTPLMRQTAFARFSRQHR